MWYSMQAIFSTTITRINASLLMKTILGALLIALFSQISIPLEPVPITLQTVAVMFIGLTYDKRSALCATIAYIIAGAVGLPVFQDCTFGFHILSGATSGYIFGFVLAAYAMASAREKLRDNTIINNSVLCTFGTVLIFICGISVLSLFTGVNDAFKYGFLPFILPGIAKIVLLVSMLGIYKRISN